MFSLLSKGLSAGASSQESVIRSFKSILKSSYLFNLLAIMVNLALSTDNSCWLLSIWKADTGF